MLRSLAFFAAGLVLALTITLGVTSARADDCARLAIGAVYSYDLTAFFEMPVQVNPDGEPRVPVKLTEQRRHFYVPAFFGSLIDITQSGSHTVFWYRDDAGAIRNASFENTDKNIIAVEIQPVDKLRFEVARP